MLKFHLEEMYLNYNLLKYNSLIFLLLFFGCDRDLTTESYDDGIPPATPSSLMITYASDGLILLQWNHNSERDLNGYKVYLLNNNSDSLLGTTRKNYFYVEELEYDSLYSFTISAFDKSGLESEKSNVVSGKPINRFAPSIVRNVEVNGYNYPDDYGINLSWNKNPEADIAKYEIYRSEISGFEISDSNFIGSVSKVFASFLDTSIVIGKKYYYKVVAVDKGNLKGLPSVENSDEALPQAELIFPKNDTTLTQSFNSFIIKGIERDAWCFIAIMENPFLTTFKTETFFISSSTNNFEIPVGSFRFKNNQKYYCRIMTYSKSDLKNVNSVSKLYSFTTRFVE